MTAIIDYDAGNVRSVLNAMKSLGEEAVLTSDPEEILGADHVIIPGEGAFGMAMEKIRQRRLEEVILEVAASGTPFLGICIGQQLLFDASEESPGVKGLGILHGAGMICLTQTREDFSEEFRSTPLFISCIPIMPARMTCLL